MRDPWVEIERLVRIVLERIRRTVAQFVCENVLIGTSQVVYEKQVPCAVKGNFDLGVNTCVS